MYLFTFERISNEKARYSKPLGNSRNYFDAIKIQFIFFLTKPLIVCHNANLSL